MTLVRGREKIWGEVVVDEETHTAVYVTRRKNNHFCWKFRGFGIQYDLFRALQIRGVDEVIVITPNNTMKSSLETWEKKGTIAILNEDDGEQIFLPDAMQDEVVERKTTQ